MSDSSNPDSPESEAVIYSPDGPVYVMRNTDNQNGICNNDDDDDSNYMEDDDDDEEPIIQILEQPQARGFRFRYECEGPSHGGLQGERSQKYKKTYPEIKILHYNGPARVVVTIVTDEDIPRPHAHKLVGKNCVDGNCIVELKGGTSKISFPNLCVQHVTRRKAAEVIQARILESIKLDKLVKMGDLNARVELTAEEIKNAKALAEKQAKEMQLNVVKLCFQAYLRDENGQFNRLLPSVLSNPIYDSKSPGANALKICRMDKSCGCCTGSEEVFLLCEKVQKDDIQVRFLEQDEDGNILWEDFGQFGPFDVHRQYAIVFKTPPYRDQNIDRAVNVLIMLQRKSDCETSDPKSFTYFPQNMDKEEIQRKRKKQLPSYPGDGFGGGGGGGDGRMGNGFQNNIGDGTSFSSPGGNLPITVNQETDIPMQQARNYGKQASKSSGKGRGRPRKNPIVQTNLETDSPPQENPTVVQQAFGPPQVRPLAFQYPSYPAVPQGQQLFQLGGPQFIPQQQYMNPYDVNGQYLSKGPSSVAAPELNLVKRGGTGGVKFMDAPDSTVEICESSCLIGDGSPSLESVESELCLRLDVTERDSSPGIDAFDTSKEQPLDLHVSKTNNIDLELDCGPISTDRLSCEDFGEPKIDSFTCLAEDCLQKKILVSSNASQTYVTQTNGTQTNVTQTNGTQTNDTETNDTQTNTEDVVLYSNLSTLSRKDDATVQTDNDSLLQVAERTSKALQFYAATGDIRKLLLVQRYLTLIADDAGDLPLHTCIINRQLEAVHNVLDVMETLPDSQKKINAHNRLLQTPLHLAVLTGQTGIVDLLLKAGAQPTVVDRNGNNAAHLAVIYQQDDCLDALLKYVRPDVSKKKPFPELDSKNFDGLTPMHIAAEKDNLRAIRTMISGKADVNMADGKSGRTPLHFAAIADDISIAGCLLLEAKAEVNAVCFDGNTPLHLACGRRNVGMVALLMAAGADPRIENSDMTESDSDSEGEDCIKKDKDEETLSMYRRGLLPKDFVLGNEKILKILDGCPYTNMSEIHEEADNREYERTASMFTSLSLAAGQKGDENRLSSIGLFSKGSDMEGITYPVRVRLSQLLDPINSGRDWRALAEILGFSQILNGEISGHSPTRMLFTYYEECGGTVVRLLNALSVIQRHDAVALIMDNLPQNISGWKQRMGRSENHQFDSGMGSEYIHHVNKTHYQMAAT